MDGVSGYLPLNNGEIMAISSVPLSEKEEFFVSFLNKMRKEKKALDGVYISVIVKDDMGQERAVSGYRRMDFEDMGKVKTLLEQDMIEFFFSDRIKALCTEEGTPIITIEELERKLDNE